MSINHKTLFTNQLYFRVFLFVPLFVAMVLSWIWPITPYGDGPFQTLNWIARIKQGQIPGRDFDVFHGIGVIWYHALLSFPCDSARGVIWIHYIGSILAHVLLWSIAFSSLVADWKRSVLYGAALSGVMTLTVGVPYFNVALFGSAGHSMMGARVAFPLIMLWLAFRYRGTSSLGRAAIYGLAAGSAAWFATDQAMASFSMALIGIVANIISKRDTIPRLLWETGACAVVTTLVALASYTGLIWISTGGSVAAAMSYWWKILPTVQFWYFGGAPNPHIHRLSDLFEGNVSFLAPAAFALHALGFLWRKPGQWALRIALLSYGLVSLVPLLGIYHPHYIAGLWCTGLIGLIHSQLPENFMEKFARLFSMRSMQVFLFLACLVLMARMAQVQFRNNSRCKMPESLGCPISGMGILCDQYPVPEYVRREYEKSNSPAILRAFYRAMPEIALNQPGVAKYDYIIHALGDEQQNDYRLTLEKTSPLFLRVPTQQGFSYAQWIWHHWPELWLSILSRYRMEGIEGDSAYWRRSTSVKRLEFESLPEEMYRQPFGMVIRAKNPTLNPQLWRLRITYATNPVRGPLAGAVDRLTRVTVSSTGTVDDQPFSWEPGGEYRTREVLLVPRAGSEVEVRIAGEGLFVSSDLIIEKAELELCRGADLESVVRMLEK